MTIARAAPYVLVAGICIAAHSGNLDGEYVYDDAPIVVENPLVASLARAPEWFTSGYWPGHDLYYRPLVIAGYAIERALFGVDARAAHAINLAWHLLAALLLTRLTVDILRLARLDAAGDRSEPDAEDGADPDRGARTGGTVAGVLFAVHPLLTEPVYWVSARSDLLGCVAVLGALLVARDERRRAVTRALLVGLIAFCGVLSKEIVAVLPGLLILDALWRWRTDPRRLGFGPKAPAVIGACLALAAYALLRSVALDGPLIGADAGGDASSPLHNPLVLGTTSQRVLTPIAILGLVARLVVLAAPLSSDYAYDSIPLAGTLGDPRMLLGLGLLVLAVALGIASVRRRGVIAWGLGFAALTWLPASNTLVLGGALFGERFAYLPAAGLAVAAGGLAAHVHARTGRSRRRAAALALAILVAIFVSIDHRRAADWRDDAALYASAAAAYPRNAQAIYNLGTLALDDAGHWPDGHPERVRRMEEAETHFTRAAEIFPAYVLARMNVGVARAGRGDWAGALDAFEAAALIDADDPRVQFNLGLAHERLGSRELAIRHYRRSAARVPLGGPAAVALRRLGAEGPRGSE